MVEGGARVIQSFLATPDSVDSVIVTVAPIFVGVEGITYKPNLTTGQVRTPSSSGLIPTYEDFFAHIQVSKYKHVRTELFGKDAVMALKV